MSLAPGNPNLSSFIWSVADLLRGDYKQSEYGKVVLPFTILRRLDCVLEPTKPAVLAELAKRTQARVNPEPFLLRKSGQLFYNTSPLDLKKLMSDQDHIGENLRAYLQAFSLAVRDIFESFEFHIQIDRLPGAARHSVTHCHQLKTARLRKSQPVTICYRLKFPIFASLREPFCPMKPENILQIRNRTAEFLIFTRQAGDDGIEVRVVDETVWLTQKLMAALFEVTVPTVNEHLTNLYARKEISEPATIRNFRTVQNEGSRKVARNVDFYNLDTLTAEAQHAIDLLQERRTALISAAVTGQIDVRQHATAA